MSKCLKVDGSKFQSWSMYYILSQLGTVVMLKDTVVRRFVFPFGESVSRVDDAERYEHLSTVITDHDERSLIGYWSTELVHGQYSVREPKQGGARGSVYLPPGDVPVQVEPSERPPHHKGKEERIERDDDGHWVTQTRREEMHHSST